MPQRITSVAQRHRSHILPTSVKEQEAALLEWKEKAQRDKKVLDRTLANIKGHKRSAEMTRRVGHWFAENTSLARVAHSCGLDLERALSSCSGLFPESFSREWAEQEVSYMELFKHLGAHVIDLRKELLALRKQDSGVVAGASALQEKVLKFRKELSETLKLLDAEAEGLLSEEDTLIPTPREDSLQEVLESTMETFVKLSVCNGQGINPALVETYRNALQSEGDSAISQLSAGKEKKVNGLFSSNDIRTVSLILKTYESVVDCCNNMHTVPVDVYDRVQQALPHATKKSVRFAVEEVLRQKRDRLHKRSVVLQYKRRSKELLESFKKVLAAEEELAHVLSCVKEEAIAREERQRKTHEDLARLGAAREMRDAARRVGEEMRKAKEDEKNQHRLRIREAEYQERLKGLQQYQEQQRQLQEKECALQQAIAEEEAVKKAMQREHNAKRVAERRVEFEEKCHLRKKHQQELEELKLAREKTLQSFFKGVERRLGVVCDPERVVKGTASSQQREPFVSFSEAAQCVVHGYTVEDVMKDPRFRIQLALLEAGLHQTPYGREVLSQGFHVPPAQRASEDNPLRMGY